MEEARERTYPIAERFVSPQGEGVWTGTIMAFIRLAGCTVGRKFPKERYEQVPHCEFKCKGGDPDLGHGPDCKYAKSNPLPIYTEMCTLYDGRQFECDTDYRMKEKLTVRELVEWVPRDVEHVCITGGEPFMHNLIPLVGGFINQKQVHVETSGTIPFSTAFPGWPIDRKHLWVTVSPKFNVLESMIERANEIKLLVDEKFTSAMVPEKVFTHDTVYIQPVNYEHAVNRDNLRRVTELQKLFPSWRVSLQLHKIMSEMLGERIR